MPKGKQEDGTSRGALEVRGRLMLLIRLPEHSLRIRLMSMSNFSVNKPRRIEAQVVESIMSRKTNTSTEFQERDRAEFLPCYKRMLLANSEGS